MRFADHSAPGASGRAAARTADPTPRPLTARETEVACGVAAGLTNHQIARHLGISPWTVTNHLRRVMWKWNCGTRVEVAVRHVSPAGKEHHHD